jgi:hypothetical protein
LTVYALESLGRGHKDKEYKLTRRNLLLSPMEGSKRERGERGRERMGHSMENDIAKCEERVGN